jgi:hypothetical protein
VGSANVTRPLPQAVLTNLIRVRPRESAANLDSEQVACVVDTKDADKAIITQLEARNAAVCSCNPDWLEFRRIERAHQVQYQDADCSGVSEEHNASAFVLLDCVVKLS